MHIPFDENIIKQKSKRKLLLALVIIFPLLFIIAMYWLGTTNYSIYSEIAKEDGVIEWLQFFLFGASGVIAFVLALKFRKISKLMFTVFLILSVGLIFVAGEEISWGQRIFGVEGYEVFDGDSEVSFLGKNVQSETNLHNFDAIHSNIGYVYLAIGAYGCFAWFFLCILDKVFDINKSIREFLPFFIVPPYLFFYFLPLGINLLPQMGIGVGPKEYEVGEFMLSLGTFLCLLFFYRYFKKRFQKQGEEVGKGV